MVWKFSRFTRKREHAVVLKSMLRRKGLRVVSITEQAEDNPTGRLLEGIIETVDEFYSENLAMEVLRGMREAASRGFWVAPMAPYGYRKVKVQDGPKERPTLEPDPETNGIVNRIFDLAESRKGMMKIVRILNDEGIASPRGKLWNKPTVHNILRNEAYLGTLVWGNNAKDGADPVRVEKAFPATVTKAQFDRVNRILRSRAPKVSHPRRVGSTFLLSGLVKCYRCKRALSGRYSSRGTFPYYVCHSFVKRAPGSCDSPRVDARQFEELVVGLIRSNILTEGNIRSLVNVVDEQMDDVAGDERKRLETIQSELADVRGRLDRLYDLVETTTEFNMADFAHRIRDHKERQERLESAAEGSRAILAQRRAVLDDVKTITAYAKDMSRFLQKSELTERRAFIETFVKEIELLPDNAVVRYTIPISQSTRKAQVLVGGGSEEFRVGDAADASRQLAEVLRDLRDRGLNCPGLVVGDGHLGIWGALRNVWPEVGEQRCWNHKILNVLDKLPKRQHDQARLMLRNIPYAETRAEAERLRRVFTRWCGDHSYEAAMEAIERDWERMVTFYDYPKEHWRHLRTTNPVESSFAALRLRTDAAKRYKRVDGAIAVIWKMLMVAEKRFRRLQAPELMADVYLGAQYVDGIAVEATAEKVAA